LRTASSILAEWADIVNARRFVAAEDSKIFNHKGHKGSRRGTREAALNCLGGSEST